jgi:hypothetical protein
LTVGRGCILLGVFTALALAVVHLQAEQTRCAAALLKSEAEWARLRGELWNVQTRLARAKAPDRIHDRATYLATGLVPPGTKDHTAPSVERLAAEHPKRRNAETPKRRNN